MREVIDGDGKDSDPGRSTLKATGGEKLEEPKIVDSEAAGRGQKVPSVKTTNGSGWGTIHGCVDDHDVVGGEHRLQSLEGPAAGIEAGNACGKLKQFQISYNVNPDSVVAEQDVSDADDERAAHFNSVGGRAACRLGRAVRC